MIPQSAEYLRGECRTAVQPSRTYRLRADEGAVGGMVDGREAMRQAIEKALLTERFQYPVYSADYGIETVDLYGMPMSYICPELERRVTEALCCDARVTGVTDFAFSEAKKGALTVSFTVHTVFGDVGARREVEI